MDPEPDPTPDPTPFFSDFKDAKKIYFFHIFSCNLPAGTLSSVFKLSFVKMLAQILFCNHYIFRSAQHDPVPYL
jgi:hypothetical protein